MAGPENANLFFSATNPCHLYELCLTLHERQRLGGFYCGYPRQRLAPPADFPYRSVGWRTTATYAVRRLPTWAQPDNGRLFRWQDIGFDRGVASKLPTAGVLHGIPGQCFETFRAAREQGITTVLNHASGPIAQQMRLVEPEYRRAGLPFNPSAIYPSWWIKRQRDEVELAQFHCVASTIVRQQLIEDGIPAEKIMVVPYGARPDVFQKRSHTPEGTFQILFAGQLSLRKGVHYLLDAIRRSEEPNWRLDTYGPVAAETAQDFKTVTARTPVIRHGPVPQNVLAKEMQKASVLVLPSAEEAFGLVVAQALQVGLPCIVSDRVGAKDLIEPGVNGSVVPFGDADALLEALRFWDQGRITVEKLFDWTEPANQLLEETLKMNESHRTQVSAR